VSGVPVDNEQSELGRMDADGYFFLLEEAMEVCADETAQIRV
jgi:hypothetical protein